MPWGTNDKPVSSSGGRTFQARTADRQDAEFGLSQRNSNISAGNLALAQQREARESQGQTTGTLPTGYRWADAAHTKQEIIPGGPADASGGTEAGGLSEQAMVKALVDGRMAFPSGAALRNSYWQNLLSQVAKADPNFDQVNYNARAATRKDFTSGASAKNITAFNTALGHLGTLYETSKELHNRSFTPWNAAGNAINKLTGDPTVDKFNTAAHASVDELEKAFRGSGGTQAGIEEWKHSLNSSQSPAQTRAVIGQMVDLLGSRINALGEQYKSGMGRSIDGITLLDPHAQAVFNALGPNGTGKIGQAPPNNNPLAGGSGIAPKPPGDDGGGGGAAPNQPGLNPSGSSDRSFVTQKDQAFADESQKAFVGGANRQQMDAIASKYGAQRFGPELDKAIAGRAANLGVQFTPHPTGKEDVGGVANSLANGMGTNVGSFVTGAGNAATFGQLDNIAQLGGGSEGGTQVAMDMARSNGLPYFAGSALGDTAGLLLGGAGAAKAAGSVASPGIAALLANPATADIAYSAAQGAGNADDPLYGAVAGALTGAAGSYGGRAAGRYAAGLREPVGVSRLNPGEAMVNDAVNKTGRGSVVDALTQAQELGVPAGLADVSPDVHALTGNAIRLSPTVRASAQKILGERGQGQYDRAVQAISNNISPVENIPQLSEQLGKQAERTAGPLYDAAYAAGGVSDPTLLALSQHPEMQSALAAGREIHANDTFMANATGASPPAPLPTDGSLDVRSLDYAKRALDRRIEGAYSGDSTAKMQLPFLKQLRGTLLDSLDSAVPEYAAARRAYAGPMQDREALEAGQAALNPQMSPDQLGIDVAGASPSQLDQMRLGAASKLADNMGNRSLSTNPFSLLSPPAIGQKLETLYGGSANSDVTKLLATRDLENQLAGSSNRLIGGSQTQDKAMADKAFSAGPLAEAALHVGAAALSHGASIPVSAARYAIPAIKDNVLNKLTNAVGKAEQVAPIALDIDPASAISRLSDLDARQQQYEVAKALLAAQGSRPGSIAGTSGIAALLATMGQ